MKTLKFNLLEGDEASAFGNLIQALNANGVPYEIRNEGIAVEIEIGDGF